MPGAWWRSRRSAEIITAPRHPYTQMLIASLPSLERKGMMQGIPGLAPLLRDLPSGCAFHPRCPLAVARCRVERPELREVAASTQAACHLRLIASCVAIGMSRLTRLPSASRMSPRRYGGGLMDHASIIALEDFSLAIEPTVPRSPPSSARAAAARRRLRGCCLDWSRRRRARCCTRGAICTPCRGTERRAFRRDIQAIFQDPYGVYNPFYRVDHVLTTPVAQVPSGQDARPKARGLIEDALRAVGLRPEEILGRYPHQLSGGQRQRVMVARALLLRPHLIVADEPVSMVDASLRATILGSLRQLNQERGISIIYITHDLATAYQVADNIIVLYRASVAEAGDVELVVKAPKHPYTQLLIASVPQVSTERTLAGRAGSGAPGRRRRRLQVHLALSGRDAGLPTIGAAAVQDRAPPGRRLPSIRRVRCRPAGSDGQRVRRRVIADHRVIAWWRSARPGPAPIW